MEKELSYIPGSIIRLEPVTNQRVAIQSSHNLAPVIDLQFPVTEPYARLVERWIIECKYNAIFLRENETSAQDDCIVISFQEDDIDVRIRYTSGSGQENEIFHKVRRINVYPREVGMLKLVIAETTASTERPHDPINPGNTEITRLKKELEREKDNSKCLQEIIDSKLDHILLTANNNRQSLSNENRTKLQKINTLNDEIQLLSEKLEGMQTQIDQINSRISNLTTQIQDKTTELDRLQRQIDDLNSQKELTDLNCDKAQADLDEIKQHMNLDAETLALLEDGYRLKHGTISKSLTAMEKEIEKIEKRIAFILKFKTKYNNAVDNSIISGDGTILTSDESGAGSDGI